VLCTHTAWIRFPMRRETYVCHAKVFLVQLIAVFECYLLRHIWFRNSNAYTIITNKTEWHAWYKLTMVSNLYFFRLTWTLEYMFACQLFRYHNSGEEHGNKYIDWLSWYIHNGHLCGKDTVQNVIRLLLQSIVSNFYYCRLTWTLEYMFACQLFRFHNSGEEQGNTYIDWVYWLLQSIVPIVRYPTY
jgi:hypothetical protein